MFQKNGEACAHRQRSEPKENRGKRGEENTRRGMEGGVEKKKERQSCALKDPKPCLKGGKQHYSSRIEVIVSLSLFLSAPLASYYGTDVCSDDCVVKS